MSAGFHDFVGVVRERGASPDGNGGTGTGFGETSVALGLDHMGFRSPVGPVARPIHSYMTVLHSRKKSINSRVRSGCGLLF